MSLFVKFPDTLLGFLYFLALFQINCWMLI